jgi:hypothetical protein
VKPLDDQPNDVVGTPEALEAARAAAGGDLIPIARGRRQHGLRTAAKKILDQDSTNEQVDVQRKLYLKNNDLIRYAEERKGGATLDLLYTVRREIAEEVSAMHFNRELLDRNGYDSTTVSRTRVIALRELMRLEVELQRMNGGSINLRGEKFQKVFSHFIDVIRDAAQATLAPEQVNVFFNALENRLVGWEERVDSLAR